MKAVILAGGLGTRLSEETDRIPKPMVTIGNWPILWHIMKVYSRHGITDFVICAGYKAHTIVEFFANYREHHSNVTIDLATNKVTCLSEAAEPWKITITRCDRECSSRSMSICRRKTKQLSFREAPFPTRRTATRFS